jgi:hypothetical protein
VSPWGQPGYGAGESSLTEASTFSPIRPLQARGRTSGIEVTARMLCAFTVRDGLIVRYQAFSERQQALEAAGLRE